MMHGLAAIAPQIPSGTKDHGIAAEEKAVVAAIAAGATAAGGMAAATSNQTEQPISLSQNLMLHRREHPKGGSA